MFIETIKKEDIKSKINPQNTHNHSMIVNSNNLNNEFKDIDYKNQHSEIIIKNRFEINNSIVSNNQSLKTNNSIINSPIYMTLIEFGYNEKYSKNLISYFHPNNLDQALEYLNEINGKIQHNYIRDYSSEIGLCFICGKLKNDHINDEYEINDDDISISLNNSSNNNNIYNRNSVLNIDFNNNFNNNVNDNFNININQLNKNNDISSYNNSSIDIGEKFICPICFRNLGENKRLILNNCGHYFCKNCWYNYLKAKILENKLNFIKCLDYECDERIPDDMIINIISKNEKLLEKYNLYSLKLEIINNPNKKFCPYPNCNSFLTKNKDKNIKNVKCENGHEFCFICLNEPHNNKLCNEKIDDNNIKEYAKNKFIKKCPNCGTYTEKNEGCNHITCAECNYQWCWLCNNKYTDNHYLNGKCRGFQFFQPKDENHIKLAFEGKIILKENERQLDINHEDNHVIRNYCLSKAEILFSCLVSLLFFLTGQAIILICLQPHFIKSNYSYIRRFIMAICYDFCIVYLWISYFFLQVYMNIITFIVFILYYGYIEFLYNFFDYVLDILSCDVYIDFNNNNNNIPSTIEFILKIIFNLFFGITMSYFPSIEIENEIDFNIKLHFCKILFFDCCVLYNLIYFFIGILISLIKIIFLITKFGISQLSRKLYPKFIYS